MYVVICSPDSVTKLSPNGLSVYFAVVCPRGLDRYYILVFLSHKKTSWTHSIDDNKDHRSCVKQIQINYVINLNLIM